MKREIVTLSAEGLTLASLEERVATAPYRGFPVVESTDEPVLLGLIDKADILVAICKMIAPFSFVVVELRLDVQHTMRIKAYDRQIRLAYFPATKMSRRIA